MTFKGICEPNPGGIVTVGYTLSEGVGFPETRSDGQFWRQNNFCAGEGAEMTNHVASYFALGHAIAELLLACEA